MSRIDLVGIGLALIIISLAGLLVTGKVMEASPEYAAYRQQQEEKCCECLEAKNLSVDPERVDPANLTSYMLRQCPDCGLNINDFST